MQGTFQGNILKLDLKPKAADAWTVGTSCFGLLAGRTAGLVTSLWLFPQGSGSSGGDLASTFARGRTTSAQPVTGWGDEGWWADSACVLTARYSNVVATFEQRDPAAGCRADIERLGKAFATLHFS